MGGILINSDSDMGSFVSLKKATLRNLNTGKEGNILDYFREITNLILEVAKINDPLIPQSITVRAKKRDCSRLKIKYKAMKYRVSLYCKCSGMKTVIFIVMALMLSFYSDQSTEQPPYRFSVTEEDLSYFHSAIVSKTKAALPNDLERIGSAIDGFMLLKAFLNLQPQDFVGVRGKDGDYD